MSAIDTHPFNLLLASAMAPRFALALTKASKAPDWVMLIPAGRVDTNDGRWFDNTNPAAIILAFQNGNLHLPFDFEHASEIKPRSGDYAPAAGWIVELANREGDIWGKVEWTERGRSAIESREVKYVSPAFNHTSDMVITSLSSAALTVRPAISTLPALTSQQKESTMDKKALCAALGLAETASDADILAAIAKGKTDLTTAQTALASQGSPSLDKFVPRADYDSVMARATTAETALASRDAVTLKTEAEAAIADGIKDGKIAPASKDYYLGTCASRDGLDKFKAFLSAAPKIVATVASGDDDKKVAGDAKALTSTQKQVARMMGLSEADYLAQLVADAKEAA